MPWRIVYSNVVNCNRLLAETIIGLLHLIPDRVQRKSFFTACHSGKLKLAFTDPNVISTSPPIFLMSRIDFTVLL